MKPLKKIGIGCLGVLAFLVALSGLLQELRVREYADRFCSESIEESKANHLYVAAVTIKPSSVTLGSSHEVSGWIEYHQAFGHWYSPSISPTDQYLLCIQISNITGDSLGTRLEGETGGFFIQTGTICFRSISRQEFERKSIDENVIAFNGNDKSKAAIQISW